MHKGLHCAALLLVALSACASSESTDLPRESERAEAANAERAERAESTAPAPSPDANPALIDDPPTGAAVVARDRYAPPVDIAPDGSPVPAAKPSKPAAATPPPVHTPPPQAEPAATAPARDGMAHRYELRAFGSTIEVYMDGQQVPASRVVLHGSRVDVLDEKGAVIEFLDLPQHWTEEAQAAHTPSPNDPSDYRDAKGNRLVPPKVMLGGRLVEPPSSVMKHLADRGVNRSRVSMVTNVMPNLPLARAGVENDDIVVAINEVPDADPATVRAMLRTLKPGETVTLRLMRGTQILDARVVTAAWDPTYMVRPLGSGGQAATGVPAAAGSPASSMGGDGSRSTAQLEEELIQAKQKIAALERQLSDKDPVRKAVRPAAVPAPTNGAPKKQ